MRALVVLALLLMPLASGRANADSYAIISEDATATSRVVSVRIDRRTTPEDLVRMAGAVQAQSAGTANRHTVVSFYLPRMPVLGRPWASVDMTPTPRAVIGGLTLEDERAYSTLPPHPGKSVLGAWLTDLPAPSGRIVITAEGNKVWLEWVQRGGLRTVEEVVATRGTRATRYDLKGGGEDYYLHKVSGELELRNKDRLIAVAEKLVPARPVPVAGARAKSPSPVPGSAPAAGRAAATEGVAGAMEAAAAHDATVTEAEAAVVEVAPPPAAQRRKRQVRRAVPTRRALSQITTTDYMRPHISQ